MERFSNILYAFVRLQDSWWANYTTGLPRSFSFSRMIIPMSVIAFGRCARRHPVAGAFVYIQKKTWESLLLAYPDFRPSHCPTSR